MIETVPAPLRELWRRRGHDHSGLWESLRVLGGAA